MTRPRFPRRVPRLAVAAALGLAGCIEDPAALPVSTVRVGALLPFSGDLAASGINLERPLIMAAETINAQGGIDGREVAVIAVDSNRYFPNPEESFETHQATLRAFLRGDVEDPRVAADPRIIPGAGIDAVIGPLVPELSVRLAAEARRNQVVHMTANVTPQSSVTGRCSFSLFPSFRALGRALGEQMIADGVERASVLYLEDDFHTKLLGRLQATFTASASPSRVLLTTPTVAGKDDYTDDLRAALAGDPEALVLFAPPRLAARVVADATVLDEARARLPPTAASPLQWYFGPLLRVDDFPNNVLGGVLAGGVGVAPGVDARRAAAFREAFQERWGAEPTLDAHYLFDTVTVLLMGLRASAAENPGVNLTSDASYAASCREVLETSREGATVDPQGALSGAAYERAPMDVDYVGLTGPVELTPRGSSGDGLVEIWRIPPGIDGRIETVEVRSTRDLLDPS